MDSSLPSELVHTNEVDSVMQDRDTNAEAHLQNGFMDRGVLDRMEDLDLPDSTPESSSQQESQSSDVQETLPRKFFLPTGVCYDARMKLHANADFSTNPHHPEDPRRIDAIYSEFRRAGLLFNGSDSELEEALKVSPTRWMWRIAAREATRAEVCLVHTASHYEWVHALDDKTSAELRDMTAQMDLGRKSLYVGNLTYLASLVSAGGAIETCKNVVAGTVKNAIAVIRPPGHHAEHNDSMGFCIFNNVPIAAKVCIEEYPQVCRKVLILDWDVHHGNGIQNIFYEDPNVLYISIHVYQNGKFYPGTPEDDDIPDGGIDKVGAGLGMGKNINIGWHDQGMGDGEYMAAFQRIVMPIAQEFDPDLVIISAGFDAAAGDELGGCYVTPECYSHMTHMLMSLANGKVAVCLEGGYNLRAISRSALAVAKTLMGEPPMKIKIPPLNRTALHVLHQVTQCQAPYWQCLREGVVGGVVLERDMQAYGANRLHDRLRSAQRDTLSKKHKMVNLYVQRNEISRSFEDQVLATPNIYQAKRILLIIHDPPEILATHDPRDFSLFPHNAQVVDPVLPYIDWAVANGYGVLDINIPSHLTQENDIAGFHPKMSEQELNNQMKDLLCYLWDNYLEGYASNYIVLMGVGDAYSGVKQLLTSRDCRRKIPSIISFVSGSLRPVKSETDPGLSSWYRNNSLIYVSPDHSCWVNEDSARKVKKQRFGGVKKSEVTGLAAMMEIYRGESMSWVDEKVREREVARRLEKGGGSGDETEEEVEQGILGTGRGRKAPMA